MLRVDARGRLNTNTYTEIAARRLSPRTCRASDATPHRARPLTHDTLFITIVKKLKCSVMKFDIYLLTSIPTWTILMSKYCFNFINKNEESICSMTIVPIYFRDADIFICLHFY